MIIYVILKKRTETFFLYDLGYQIKIRGEMKINIILYRIFLVNAVWITGILTPLYWPSK